MMDQKGTYKSLQKIEIYLSPSSRFSVASSGSTWTPSFPTLFSLSFTPVFLFPLCPFAQLSALSFFLWIPSNCSLFTSHPQCFSHLHTPSWSLLSPPSSLDNYLAVYPTLSWWKSLLCCGCVIPGPLLVPFDCSWPSVSTLFLKVWWPELNIGLQEKFSLLYLAEWENSLLWLTHNGSPLMEPSMKLASNADSYSVCHLLSFYLKTDGCRTTQCLHHFSPLDLPFFHSFFVLAEYIYQVEWFCYMVSPGLLLILLCGVPGEQAVEGLLTKLLCLLWKANFTTAKGWLWWILFFPSDGCFAFLQIRRQIWQYLSHQHLFTEMGARIIWFAVSW